MYNPFRNIVTADQLPKDRTLDDIPSHSMWAFIWFFIRQVKWPTISIAVLYIFSSGIDALGPYFIKVLVDGFQTTELTDDIWITLGWSLPIFIVVFLFLQPILGRIATALIGETRPAFNNMMRRQLSIYMSCHHYQYFQNDFSGRLASKVLETPYAIVQITTSAITSLLHAIMTLLVSFILFLTVDIYFGFIALGWLIGFIAICYFYIPKIINVSHKAHDDVSKIRGRYVDGLNNISNIIFFGRFKHEDLRLLETFDEASESGSRNWRVMNMMFVWLEVLSVMFIASVFYACVVIWQKGELTLGEIAMILPLMLTLMHIAWWVSDLLTGIFENLGQVREGMETITKSKIQKDDSNKKQLKVTKGHIEFKDIKFHYGETDVFKGLNLDIPQGQKLGVVGHSGAGKTTLTNMMFRLFDAQSGQILIDGQNIYDTTKQSLREQIAIIPQTTDMFHRSLIDNIRYGRLDATDAEIIAAAKKAHAHEFISKLPDGYETMVGERGVKLSGGQRQRIAIARAILKDAPILILDEATSALDSESEKAIQDALKGLMKGKTVIAIAHRLSTIAHLDRIIVMEDGEIIEDGTHDELLKKDRHYAMLWSMQSGGFLQSS